MLRYAITDRRIWPGDEAAQRLALVRQAGRLARAGVEFLQVREKDLPFPETVELAVALQKAVAAAGGNTQVFLHADAALDGGESLAPWPARLGVHLSQRALERMLTTAKRPTWPGPVSVSCHSAAAVERARAMADVLLFAPVFEKRVGGQLVVEGAGLAALSAACRAAKGVPVLALGGVTLANTEDCIAAGAAGVAGIRLFQ